MTLYLASASPRRLELLLGDGWRPEVIPQDAPEARLPGESPEAMVERLARLKIRAALARLSSDRPEGIVLAADTAVVLEDEVLGKPAGAAEARAMLRRLAGRVHRVLSGVALIHGGDGREAGGVVTTRVGFSEISAGAIRRYVATGSALDKAGAYGIQDVDDGWIVSVEGSRSNVVGLPLEQVNLWLEQLGARR